MIRSVVFIGLLIPLLLWVLPSKTSTLQLAVDKEENEKLLQVEGKFPDWLDGVLVRNSSIPIYQDGKQISHEFDGLAMLHSFAFNKGNVFYSNRFLETQQHDAVVNKGSADFAGFASQPTFWQKVQNYFTFSNSWVNNASVNVFKFGNNYVALTETPLPACFDLKTLQSMGSFSYQDSLPKSRCWESAHPHMNFSNKEIVNYLIEFGPQSYYVLYKMNDDNSRNVIARVPVDMPSYMHSFAATDNYIILTEFPLVVDPADLLKNDKPFIHNFVWLPEKGTRFYVIDKNTGEVVSKMHTDAFFSFHHANAYENGNEIIVDIVAYPSIASLPDIFPQASNIHENNSTWSRRLMRYHLSPQQNQLSSEVLLEHAVEFPRFNERLDGKKYRYLYMTLEDKAPVTGHFDARGLGKLNLTTREFKTWSQPGSMVNEPVFVPSPHSRNEDEGVVLTVIYDEDQKKAYLLALDGHSFTEVARAELPWHIPGSFHGQYFGESIFKNNEVR